MARSVRPGNRFLGSDRAQRLKRKTGSPLVILPESLVVLLLPFVVLPLPFVVLLLPCVVLLLPCVILPEAGSPVADVRARTGVQSSGTCRRSCLRQDDKKVRGPACGRMTRRCEVLPAAG